MAWRRRVPTPAGDYEATLRSVADLVAAAREAAGGRTSIGFATPGMPGEPGLGGLMKNCNSTCLNGRPLQRDLQAALGQRVALTNDANCLALSEATDGAGAGAAVVFAVILGTGVGGGIAVHGRVLEGANGLAGEWGHNPLPWADAQSDAAWPCYCGRSGCVETLLCGPGLAREHGQRHGGALDAKAIAQAALAGDAACRATLARHAERLGRALAGVLNLLDPEVIVLGGGLSLMPHLYLELPAIVQRWVFATGEREPLRTRIVPALHGDSSGVRGAAWLGRALAG